MSLVSVVVVVLGAGERATFSNAQTSPRERGMPHTSRLKGAIILLLIRYAPLHKATILVKRGPYPVVGTPGDNSPHVVMPQ